jgi:hypothetical protein
MTDERYQTYLASREWGLKREGVIRRSGGICERCRRHPGRAVHHLTYARLYDERLEDLQHICGGCHDYQHGKSPHDPAALRVYMAGAVVEDEVLPPGTVFDENCMPVEGATAERIIDWRGVAFYSENSDLAEDYWTIFAGRPFIYAGPDIDGQHGCPTGDRHSSDTHASNLVARCIRQVRSCDAVLAWIDRENTIGTIVEITAAIVSGIPVYMAFQSEELRKHFYFVSELVGDAECASVVQPSPEAAWSAFVQWAATEWRPALRAAPETPAAPIVVPEWARR